MKVIRVTIRAEVVEVDPDTLLQVPDPAEGTQGFVVYGRSLVHDDGMIPALVAHEMSKVVAEAIDKVAVHFPEYD